MCVLNRFNIDLLAMVVLGGTFPLAMSFASNDLLNFVGVPLAGLPAEYRAEDQRVRQT